MNASRMSTARSKGGKLFEVKPDDSRIPPKPRKLAFRVAARVPFQELDGPFETGFAPEISGDLFVAQRLAGYREVAVLLHEPPHFLDKAAIDLAIHPLVDALVEDRARPRQPDHRRPVPGLGAAGSLKVLREGFPVVSYTSMARITRRTSLGCRRRAVRGSISASR